MKYIKLQSRIYKNMYTIIDNEDYHRISKYNWNVNNDHNKNRFYAQTSIKIDNKYYCFPIHRMILNLDKNDKIMVDHIDHDGLNNQKSNLRVCTNQQNQANQNIKNENKSSIYKGVYKYGKYNRWISGIKFNNKRIHLGYFISEIEAAKAYDKKARELFGEFAHLNFKD